MRVGSAKFLTRFSWPWNELWKIFNKSVEKNKMKVLFHDSDRNLGARNLDYILADLLGEEFNKKYGCDPRKTPRTRLRLLDGIERARKILSANTESTVHLESLMNDEDLHKALKRADWEALVMP